MRVLNHLIDFLIIGYMAALVIAPAIALSFAASLLLAKALLSAFIAAAERSR
jgi:hypothetical protein